MKANASTNTTPEIEDYRIQKKLSLQPLFLPELRYQLLLEKVIYSLYNPAMINNENQFDFANKSIFIYNYKKRKNINNSLKKTNSIEKINVDRFEYRKRNNNNFLGKNISVNDALNNKKMLNLNNSTKNINNKITNIKNKFHRLSLKDINNSRNNISPDLYQSKTSEKKNLRENFYFNRFNLSDVKTKLFYNIQDKIKEGERKDKLKVINKFKVKKNKKKLFLINNKEKYYKFKIKKSK